MKRNLAKTTRGPAIGCAALVLLAAAGGIWFVQATAERGDAPATGAVKFTQSGDMAAKGAALPSPSASPALTNLPTLPDKVVRHVRDAYPLLQDVDFACDVAGCAVTATIPPPTGKAFLKKRQEMLLGGLARLVEADGYKMIGPVQMEEVDDNLFHIRAQVTSGK